MAKLNIIDDEIARRKDATASITLSEASLKESIEQFNVLDEFYRDQEKTSREDAECIYKENRHFTGEWPIVYSFADTEKYPFYGLTDPECNPYFPITKVQDGTFDGLAPFPVPTTKTGAHQRQRTFAATEDIPRLPALTQLQNFPDISAEPLPDNWPAAQAMIPTPGFCTPTATPDTEAQCTIEGGVWTPPGLELVPDPVWVGPDTGSALLRVVLEPWRADVVAIIADLCKDDSGDEATFWQAIVDDIDIVLPEIATDAVFVRATGNNDPAAWGQTQAFTGLIEAARVRLETAANTGVVAHKTPRQAKLDGDAVTEEDVFFGLVKLRLHQANGSYAKIKAAKGLDSTNESIKADNEAAVASLNVMKVKNS